MAVSSVAPAPARQGPTLPKTPAPLQVRQGSRLDRTLRRLLLGRLEKIRSGRIVLREAGQEWTCGRHSVLKGPHPSPLPEGEEILVEVRDPRFYRRVAFGGSLGAAEAYIDGLWNCDDLVGLVRILCRDLAVLEGLETGWARLLGPWRRLRHRLRRNTLAGSRRNIAAHYDLGDDFFRLFLDETMAYSCAFFPRPESSLHEASLAKFEMICRKLKLQSADRLLDVGGGWGGLAVYAATHYGCRVTATTISRRQYDYARRLVAEQGLTDRVRVLCEDYRNVLGTYDKLASVGMIEHVGCEYYGAYFRSCAARLKPGGRMLLQSILMPEQLFEAHRRSVDFIRRYIFPGGCLPSLGALCRAVGRASDFQVAHLEDLTPHYARTLAVWRERFWRNEEAVRALGFDDAFLRLWNYYLCTCEGGFRERTINVAQILLLRP
ncbi:MAG: class I SAM-dependent methyltransferase [Pirellulales bacterium]|nr:class I SAM-dependent methyltransferase [Pirellulales bacterium]